MDRKVIAAIIDHAVLKPEMTDSDLERECGIALKYGVASVCVKPSHVNMASRLLQGSEVKVCTVIGFPHGSVTTRCKVEEALDALKDRAHELDMVINVGKLLSGDFDYVRNDIKAVADTAHDNNAILKVIIETSLLDNAMKETACRLAEEAGADFVKTSTGFNGGGATIEDILLMRNSVSSRVRLKASGGIKSFGQAVEFAKAGCSRLGTSNTVSILNSDDSGEAGNY